MNPNTPKLRAYYYSGNNWSSYKHGTTKKLLLAVGPWGNAKFVSELADGSMSDRHSIYTGTVSS